MAVVVQKDLDQGKSDPGVVLGREKGSARRWKKGEKDESRRGRKERTRERTTEQRFHQQPAIDQPAANEVSETSLRPTGIKKRLLYSRSL